MTVGSDHTLRDTWRLIFAVVLATACWMSAAGLTLVWRTAVLPAGACLGLECLALVYRVRRPDPRLAACLSGVAQLVVFSAAAACLSYAVAATAGPFRDQTLLAIDRALGLDWRAYLAFVDARPWLGRIFTVAYQSLEAQLVLVIPLLGFTSRIRELRRFLLAFMATTVATVLISALVPALAMYSVLHLKPEDFSHLDPAAAYVHVAALQGLRDGSLHVLSLADLEGIVTFPSLHAALGVLLMIAFWPLRRVRWPAVAFNALLVAATPIDGGHYFADVVAGLAIALLAYAAAAPRAARAPLAAAAPVGISGVPGSDPLPAPRS